MNNLYRDIIKNYNLLYLLYIRYKIKNIKNINDIINIFRKINYYYSYNLTTDTLLDFLIKCMWLYPLSDIELQKISLFQQEYNYEYNIAGYVTITLWLAAIQSLMNDNSKPNINTKLIQN